MPQPLDIELLMRVPCVEPDLGFDISPDGKQIAFSWNISGKWEIYTLSLAEPKTINQISLGEGAKFSPRFHPNNKTLAFVTDFDGGENYDIFLHHFETGKQKNVTPNTPEALTTAYSWSPDGDHLAICSDRDGRFDTYIMPSTGGENKKVLDYPKPDWVVRWSPSAKHLLVTSEADGQDYHSTIVPIDDDKTPFDISIDGKPICAKHGHWSPDGNKIAFASNYSGIYQIAIYDLQSEKITWITQDEGEKEHPHWSPDGKYLTYILSRGADCFLALQSLDKPHPAVFQIEPGVIYLPQFTPDGEKIIFVFDNPKHPCDLWQFEIKTTMFTQLTFSLPATFSPTAFVLPDQIRYPSLDGAMVPALLYQPETHEPLPPAVIIIHGGPNWLFQITWDPLIQHMVSRGWVVLAPNYRGSTGYGREWQLASRFDLGGVDTEDIVGGANYLEENSLADPKRIAVTGRSWGGYLTMTCLTQYPHRWAAGSAAVPFLNWFTSHKNSRQDLQHWDRENFGDPEKNYDLWYARSPYFFLDRIEAPVQLLCGENDVRCPASESLQAKEKLNALGKVCDYISYPDEGHSLLKIENQVDAKKRRALFLAKYLEKQAE